MDGPTEVARPGLLERPGEPLALGPIGRLGTTAAPDNQSETAVAASGSLVVAGFNDFIGFSLPGPLSFSGVMYSTDGGDSFTYSGRLPAAAGTEVRGDPSVAVWTRSAGPPVFFYASLFTNPAGQHSLCIHRSTDGGASWAGPFEIGTAPSGSDFPDREWIAVDPETGRLLVSWTHFGSSGVTIRAAYSDDAATASPPTWSAATTVGARPWDGQCTFVASDPHGPNVYLAWESYPFTGFSDTSIGFSRSTNNGVTWSPATDIGPGFWHHLAPYGFDRWLWSVGGLVVNPIDGALEVVFAASQNGTPAGDFGDIRYIRSTDAGASWSVPVALDAFPGADRAQCFPSIAAAPDGRLDAHWYDLSAGSGRDDWTDVFYTFSTDFGAHWSSPVPVTPAPWRNEAGNNFGAPHQGDYLRGGVSAAPGAGAAPLAAADPSLVCFAWMAEPRVGSTGADPAVASIFPPAQFVPLRVRPGSVGVVDYGCVNFDGHLVAGEYGDLDIPLENIGRSALAGASASLASLSPDVSVIDATRAYGSIAPGAIGTAVGRFRIRLSTAYPCGEPARFRLTLSASGVTSSYDEFSLPTGVPISTTTLFSESFDGVAAPALPAGWSSLGQAGAADPWVTSAAAPASPPNSAFVPEIGATTFTRLEAPVVAVPASADYIEISFKLRCALSQYDARSAPDGVSFEYQLDGAGGSHFATADADQFDDRYTHNLERASGNGSGDRSAWSGISAGYQPVRIRIPGIGGHTVRPRFDLTTTDALPTGGVWIDDVKIVAVDLGCGACGTSAVALDDTPASPRVELLGPNPFQDVTALGYVTPRAGRVRIDVISIAGQRLRTLVDRYAPPGVYSVPLRAREPGRPALKPGVYLVRMTAGSDAASLRIVSL